MFGKKKRRSRGASSASETSAPGAGGFAAGAPVDGRIGRYTDLEQIGQGGMGTVYRAHDPVIGRDVAIKVISIRDDLAEEEATQYRELFLREAQAAGALLHPQIVAVHDIGMDPATRRPYIVMEHVAGQDLKKVIRSRAPLPKEEAVRITLQIASALDFAHRRGIVHRDVKPANVLLSEGGQVKITDFGVARLPGSDLTRSDQFVGSPGFMSPEQLKGAAVDGRSDLFALGVILYQLLTGKSPFDGESVSEVLYKITTQPVEPPSEVLPDVSPDFDPILEKALCKDPAGRYQTGKEMMAALVRHSGEIPEDEPEERNVRAAVAPAAAARSRGRAARRPARNTTWKSLGALVAALVLALVGINWAIHALFRGPLGKMAGEAGASRGRGPGGAPGSLAVVGGAFPAPAGHGPAAGGRGARGAAAPGGLPRGGAKGATDPKQIARVLATSRSGRAGAGALALDHPTARLRVELEHHLASGRLVVLVDGRTVLSKPFDAPKGKKSGTLSHVLSVPAGRHGLEVRVLGDKGDLRGKSKISAVLSRDQVAVLKAEQKAKASKGLTLEWE